jgi:hypothetical protein
MQAHASAGVSGGGAGIEVLAGSYGEEGHEEGGNGTGGHGEGGLPDLKPVFYAAEKAGYWEAVAGAMPKRGGKTRRYFIQAEEVEWNYTPEGYNRITGEDFTDDEKVFTSDFAGSTYIKCLYFGCVQLLCHPSCSPPVIALLRILWFVRVCCQLLRLVHASWCVAACTAVSGGQEAAGC